MSTTDRSGEMLRKLEAVKATLEWSKQIGTLASGFVILSGTFVQVFRTTPVWRPALFTSWVLMSISILFGVLYMAAASSHLASVKEELDILDQPGRTFALVHVTTFLLGFGAFVVFIAANL